MLYEMNCFVAKWNRRAGFFFLLTLIFLSVKIVFAATNYDSLFPPKKNFCDRLGGDHSCAHLPQNSPPKTIIVIHGMNSSLGLGSDAANFSNYIRLLSFLNDLGAGQSNYHVYGIDFNSSGSLKGEQSVRLVKLNFSKDCNASHHWKNCWELVEESKRKVSPFKFSVREVSEQIQQLLATAAAKGYLAKVTSTKDGGLLNPVTIISHSMGGLIARDLLYIGPGNITGYEYLMNKGIWINEYISLAAPHNHGFFGIDNAEMRALVADSKCLDLQSLFEKTSVMAHEFCASEAWVTAVNEGNNRWLNGQLISLSKIDFPQIHWVFVSGSSGRLVSDQSLSDGVVDWRSAQYELFSGDETERADNRVYLNEYQNKGNHLKLFDNNTDLPVIPGQRGQLAKDASILPYSGFVENSNVNHSNLTNVGYYFGGDIKKVENLKVCSATGQVDAGVSSCVGYFQYIIPATTLCTLPGYTQTSPYFKKNPQFFPNEKIANFSHKCELHGLFNL